MFARRSFLSLPPSAKFLYVLLKDRHRMSRHSRLKALGLIREEEHDKDARERVYELVQAPM